MKIGFVGLGKLGLPCALAIERFGNHEVVGYDVNPDIKEYLLKRKIPYREKKADELLFNHEIQFLESINDVVNFSEIVFVPVQTPHEREFEGDQPLPLERKDFNYSYIKAAINEIAVSASNLKKKIIVILISTVLPGTFNREIEPLLNEYIDFCYNPFFIAMGTTIDDFIYPEFVLLGNNNNDNLNISRVIDLYKTIHDRPIVLMDITSAELTKVAYNTFITSKIVFVNILMEICDKIGGNVDSITSALKMANERIISTKYMDAGMQDGGGCHPRDNIALSWFAREYGISYDFFGALMKAREEGSLFLLRRTKELMRLHNKKKLIILGKSFKPETNLVVGSPSVLLFNQAIIYNFFDNVEIFDPEIDDFLDQDSLIDFGNSVAFFIGTKHSVFKEWRFPLNSLIIDPWGYIPKKNTYEVYWIGRQKV